MTPRLLPIPALNDNYIWALVGAAGALVVDPGEAQPVIAALGGVPRLQAILLTHHHGDHVGGVADLLAHWPGTPVYGPVDPRIATVTHPVAAGDRVDISGWQFTVIEVPGHTRTHVAFHGEGLLFCGDTLFSLGCGRLFEGTPAQMHASLQALATLPGDTRVCCGHEYTVANAAFARVVDPANAALADITARATERRLAGQASVPSRMADERAANPFLRCADITVRAAVERYAGRPLADPIEVFAALRAWKDAFRA